MDSSASNRDTSKKHVHLIEEKITVHLSVLTLAFLAVCTQFIPRGASTSVTTNGVDTLILT
jgi:hypothetical protein